MRNKLPISPAEKSKHNRLIICSLFIFITILSINQTLYAQNNGSIVRAGLRSSTYGFSSFPDTTWWFNATTDMASRFSGASPAVIWILGYTTNDGCYVGFPNPNPGTSYDKIFFANNDKNEAYLNAFDRNGVKVWLQIEPGFADIPTLIDLVLNQYGHHPSVIGFGVDAEWYKTSAANNYEGEAVTDAEAEAWSIKIKSYNENYLLFTKHWLISKMPPTFRNDIVFVDDSQIFPNMQSMINEFKDWSQAFAPAKVAFQYGYVSDKPWWENLADPPKNIGDEILNKCPNVSDLFWVDFTAYDIWPEDFNPTSVHNNFSLPEDFELHQNYPNPFNPTTTISFELPVGEFRYGGTVHLQIYDVLGKEIKTLVNGKKAAGTYEISFDATGFSSGVYYYRLTAGSFSQTKKMLLLR